MGNERRDAGRDEAIPGESFSESVLAHLGPDVRLLEQTTAESAFEESDGVLPIGRLAAEYAEGFVHPDADDSLADMGDAGHTSLSVARSLPKGLGEDDPGDDDDHGADPAHAEHAARNARYAEPGNPVPWLPGDVVGSGPNAEPVSKPGRDALDYLRSRVHGDATAHSHWSRVARDHETPAHALLARLFQALIPAVHRGGFEELEGIVGLVELVATRAPLNRFYSEQSEPYRHVIEDAETVTMVASAAFGDTTAMVAALLNGDVVDALARREQVLARLDRTTTDARPTGPGGAA